MIKRLAVFFIFVWVVNPIYDAASGEEAAYLLEPIVVVPTKASLLQSQSSRKITVISKEEIERLPVTSVPELMKHTLGVDIRQRGALGVQADVNMQGAGFEQVLISINGVRLNDPQSGHHNMDLPVTLMDIERIEILPGQGSSLYGPQAFAGIINIVTKDPKGKGLELESSGGGFGFSSQALSITYPLGTFNNRISFARKESSGYRPDTDFEITSLSFNSQKDFSFGALEFLFGFTDKEFGADSFYSNLYPQEEEHTDTRFFNLKAHIRDTIWQLQSSVHYRRHSDKFILDRTRPSFYVNYHTSYSYGGDLEVNVRLPFGSLLTGAELVQEKITSTRLGSHKRDNQALYAQFQSPEDQPLICNLGLRLDHYQTWGWQTSPSLSIGYKINPQLSLKASGGRSFRIPSFTDLYYSSPANIGNKDLTPEKAWSFELGCEYDQESLINAELTYFHRWADDLIGWVRSTSSDPWEAQNIAEVDTQGIELDFLLFSKFFGGYVYQYSESEDTDLDTKYALEFLKHHAHLGLNLLLPWEISESLSLSYKQRVDQKHYFLLDSRLSKKFKKRGVDYEIFLDITNLFNTSYSEQGDVRMPGRWIIGGMKVKL